MKKYLRKIPLANLIYAKVFKKEKTSADVLSEEINRHNYKTYAEVGVWQAKTLKKVLKKSPSLHKVFAIDPYLVGAGGDDPSHIYEESQKFFDKVYNKARVSTPSKCVFVRDFSVRAARLFKPRSLDIVFIDAAHTYKELRKDIEAWLPKIRKGGIIAGHDFSHRFPGIVKIVLEKFGAKTELKEDKIWLVRI